MPTAYIGGHIVELPSSSSSLKTSNSILSYNRKAGDLKFLTELDIRGILDNSTYLVAYNSDGSAITSGRIDFTPTYFSPVSAFSENDGITLYGAKYGYSYGTAAALLVRGSTLVYQSQVVNTNIVLSETEAGNLIGIEVNAVTKKIIVSTSHSQSELYDYLQYYQSLVDNVSLLQDGEIFSTVLGNSYTLNSSWNLIFTAAPTGTWNLSGKVTFNAEFDISNFNLTGTLFFDVSSTLTATDSSIDALDTVDGNETVSYTPSGTSNSPTNLDATNITIVAPLVYTGLDFTGLVAGSQVVIFETGTTTEIQRNNSSKTQETWSELYSADQVIDYTIMKVGYAPIRVTNLTAVNTVQAIAVQQKIARSYVSGISFIYGTDATFNTTTKEFEDGALTDCKGQDFYSVMIEAWIAETSLRNVLFPINPNGSNSYSFDDVTIADALIAKWYRDGIRTTASGTVKKKWAAIWSSGDVGTDTAEIQQTDGATPIKGYNAITALNQGVVDMMLLVYDVDAGFDKQDYLVVEYAKAGKYQGRIVAHDVYDSIADELYVIAVSSTPSPITGGDPTLANPPVITRHAPVSWNGKSYSITITDSIGGNSGEDISQWLNWNIREENDTAFQGDDPFNYYDYVKDSGGSWKTVSGTHIGFGTVGVRVVQNDGTTVHSDFLSFEADDGTTYTVPVVANISITNLPNDGVQRLQIYNLTTSLEYYNDDPANVSYSDTYTDGVGITAGDSIRIRFAEMNGATSFKLFTTVVAASVDGFSVDSINFIESDIYYAANGLDGLDATVQAKFSGDFPNDEIDFLVAGYWTSDEAYAYFCSTLITPLGIEAFWGGVRALEGAYEIMTEILNLRFNNNVNESFRRTDAKRIFRSDGSYPVREPTTTGYGVGLGNWQVPVSVVTVATGNAINKETVKEALTEQGYTSLRATTIDKADEIHTRLGMNADKPTTNNADGSFSADGIAVNASVDGSGNITHHRQ